MRWRLLVLVSVVAALVAAGVWCLLMMIIFGSVRPIQPHDSLLLASAVVPLGMSVFAGIFIYRHTSRKRKTQASVAVLLTLLLSITTCSIATRLFPHTITIYRAGQLRS